MRETKIKLKNEIELKIETMKINNKYGKQCLEKSILTQKQEQ